MSTSTAKRIQFNRADKDYSAYYDGELIGTYGTYHQAEIELDAHALDLLERGLLDIAEGITTMQWQQPRDVVYARPAEAVELVYSADPTNDGVPSPNDGNALYRAAIAADNAWQAELERLFGRRAGDVRYTPEGCTGPTLEPLHAEFHRASSAWRQFMEAEREAKHAQWLSTIAALPAASPAVETIARTSDSSDGLRTPTGGREDAAPMSGFFMACSICGGPHRATQCPQVALVKYGMGVWEAYMEDRAAFLKLTQWATAPRLKLMGDAVAFYLSHRWRRTITTHEVLVSWQQNAASA